MAAPGITGDFGTIAAWEKLFDNADVVLELTSKSMAEEAVSLVKDGFRKTSDPYGNRWKFRKRRKRLARSTRKRLTRITGGVAGKVLHGKTGRLKSGWHVTRSDKRGFRISPSVNYATFHQTGTKRMVRRAMVPYRALPKKWVDSFDEAATEAMGQYFSSSKGARAGGSRRGLGFLAGRIAAAKRQLGIRALIRRLATAGEE